MLLHLFGHVLLQQYFERSQVGGPHILAIQETTSLVQNLLNEPSVHIKHPLEVLQHFQPLYLNTTSDCYVSYRRVNYRILR